MLRLFLMTVFLAQAIAVSTAKADVIVWEDSKNGVTLTYPDDWRRVNNQDADIILTLAAPSGDDHAICKLRVREDKRYLIYPRHMDADVQKLTVNQEFWQNYIVDYYSPVFEIYYDEAGLGRGYGSYALAEFTDSYPGGDMRRRAMMLGSMYNGDIYIMECSAENDAYTQWAKAFLSLARSVDFDKTLHESYAGNYRDFLDSEYRPILFRDVDKKVGKTY